MVEYALHMPPAVYEGENAYRHALCRMGQPLVTVAVLTDAGVAGAGLLEKPLNALQESGIGHVLIDNIPAEPEGSAVTAAVRALEKTDCQGILAIGGGSVLDTAKLATILYRAPYGLADLLADSTPAQKQLPLIAVPTTAGTGSEATPNGIVTLPERGIKVGIVCRSMLPDAVVLDAANLANLPPHIAAATGMDALAHAVESYTSNKANAFSRPFSLTATKMIFASFADSLTPGGSQKAKRDMLYASFWAGVAIAASGTTAAHALAYPLGGRFRVPHGVSNAVLLPHVLRANMEHCRKDLAELCDAAFPELFFQPEEAKAALVVERVEQLAKTGGIPGGFARFGVKPEDGPALAEEAYGVRRLLDNNKRDLSIADILNIYNLVMGE